MSVAKSLPLTDPFFIQDCPICGQPNRMMIRGNYVEGDNWQRFPDIGYSFCNCRHIFYTRWENVKFGVGWNGLHYPIEELHNDFYAMKEGETKVISMLDPYFINWNAPHEMRHWECRHVYILWDMDSFADECRKSGFIVLSAERDMRPDTTTPQHFHIKVKKP